MSMHSKLLAGLLAVGCLVGTTSAQAQTQMRASWVNPNDPRENAVTAYMHVFADTAAKLSGGEIDVALFPNGQLGDQRATVQQVARGTIQLGNVASGVIASLAYPRLGVLDLPYLFHSRAHFREVMDMDNPFIRDLADDVAAETGIRILSFQPFGFRNLTTRDAEVHTPADMANLKIRTMEVVPHQRMMERYGAVPVPVPFLELYTGLQTGVVDGQENPASIVLQQNLWQVQKNMIETQHVMSAVAIITNERWYQGLSDEERRVLHAADAEGALANDGVGAMLDLVSTQALRDKGMNVISLSPEESAAFRDAVSAPLQDWAETEYDPEFVQAFFAHLAQFEDK